MPAVTQHYDRAADVAAISGRYHRDHTAERRPRALRLNSLERQGDPIPIELATQTPLAIVRSAKEFLQASVNVRPVTRLYRRGCVSATPTGLPFEEAERDMTRRPPSCMMRSGSFRHAESAPPTRGVHNAPLSPIRMPSPPRTDPPRRRRRKNQSLGPAENVPDSPIPSPNGARRRRKAGYHGRKGDASPQNLQNAVQSSLMESARVDVEDALPMALNATAVAENAIPRRPQNERAESSDATSAGREVESARTGDISDSPVAAARDGLGASMAPLPNEFSPCDEPGLDESLEWHSPCCLEKLFRPDCDYWDDGEDHISPSPRLPGERAMLRGRSPGGRSLDVPGFVKLPLGRRLSGQTPDGPPDGLLGSFESSSSSGPKLAPSVHSDEEESRLDQSVEEAIQLPAGAVRGDKFCWVRGELIGRGSLGCVHKALEALTGQLMAVKEVLLDAQDQTDDKFRKQLQNEIDLYKDMQHPRIVAYLGHDYIEGRLFIYLEYMAGNSIAQVLAQFGPLDESLICRYTHNLLEGLEYLHTRDPPVLHRDIKGANILVGIDRTVKLSDFGCSKRLPFGTAIHTLRGSIPWMAPEVMTQSGYGRKADIWSLGCVLIEMITAEAPWGAFDNCLAAMARIAMSEETPPVPSNLSALGQAFVVACTKRAPQERPDAVDLLKHDFVAGLNRSSIDESWG